MGQIHTMTITALTLSLLVQTGHTEERSSSVQAPVSSDAIEMHLLQDWTSNELNDKFTELSAKVRELEKESVTVNKQLDEKQAQKKQEDARVAAEDEAINRLEKQKAQLEKTI